MQMKWLVTGVAFLLFAAGVVWARIFGVYPAGSDLTSVVGLLTAVGTMAAAIAAWKAATRSQEQLTQMQQQNRWQQYDSHYLQFDRLIAEIERVTSLRFFYRWPLYEALFPTNRDLAKTFSLTGDVGLLKEWHDLWWILASIAQTRGHIEPAVIDDWAKGVHRLANKMMIEIEPPHVEQLRNYPDTLNFGITKDNCHEVLFRLESALNILSEFGNCSTRSGDGLTNPHSDFVRAVKSFLNQCKNKMHRGIEYS